MSLPAARLGDAICHGGAICTGSCDVSVNNLPSARMGDAHGCALHGGSCIAAGWPTVTVNNLPMATLGMPTACGAAIVTGSCDVLVG